MSLLPLLQTIVQSEQKVPGSNVHTEFILPFRLKKEIMTRLRTYNYSTASPSQIEELWYALSIMNRYLIEDPGLTALFFYLCSLKKPDEIMKRVAFKDYVTPDIIPQPHYQFVKSKLALQNKLLGDYSSHTCRVNYMIGKVLGFTLFTKDGKEVASYTEDIKSI